MKDCQEVMMMFVKIVERYPEIYDSSKDLYKMRYVVETAWEKVAADVTREIKEECTVEELKVKWKGIRSSFNRFKNKLCQARYEANPCKTYYLYDALRFLDPFIKPKLATLNHDMPGGSFDANGCFIDVNNDNKSTESNPGIEEWEDHDVKPDINLDTDIHNQIEYAHNIEEWEDSDVKSEFKQTSNKAYELDCSDSDKETHQHSKSKKRKYIVLSKVNADDNEDMQFFRSILPDIQNFSSTEKRKLKMGVLKLIDEIENDRKLMSSNEVTSS